MNKTERFVFSLVFVIAPVFMCFSIHNFFVSIIEYGLSSWVTAVDATIVILWVFIVVFAAYLGIREIFKNDKNNESNV